MTSLSFKIQVLVAPLKFSPTIKEIVHLFYLLVLPQHGLLSMDLYTSYFKTSLWGQPDGSVG